MTNNTTRGSVSGKEYIRVAREGDEARPRVAILGTGRMGAAIARRVAGAGFELTLWNRTREKAESLGTGRVAETPADAVRAADVVLSSLTGPEAVRETYLGDGGALRDAQGVLFVEMSTAGAHLPVELGPEVEAAGARLVDAPVLGSPSAVEAGKAALLVGGADADVERAMPVLKAIGLSRHVGPLGNAARLKLVANSMLAALTVAAAELEVAGERAGLNPEDVWWVLERNAPVLGARRRGFVDDRHEPVLFALRDLRKDLDLALDLFGESAAMTPVTVQARQLVSAAAVAGGGLDITAVTRPFRRGYPAHDGVPVRDEMPARSSTPERAPQGRARTRSAA